ncbi:MAG TPA: cation:proton antiporter [Terriglobales bacterium]|nr:cation:proton antiporter [Terriglobales bacterium]
MTEAQFGSFALVLLLLIACSHLLGLLFTRLRQPRVIGEILAGLILGPSCLARFAPHFSATIFPVSESASSPDHAVLGFLYTLGMLLLMFHSGAETRRLFGRDERRETMWLGGLGTLLPFVLVMLAAGWLPLDALSGVAHQRTATLLVLGIAVSVTSIPVISRIFHDMGILHTRFARLVLGVAVMEDIALWAVLAVATSLAGAAALSRSAVAWHVFNSILYFSVGLVLGPPLLRRLHRARWNLLAKASPTGYLCAVLFAYAAVAAVMGVSLVFAAFLAGFAAGCDPELLSDSFESLSKVSYGIFIPIYFAVVGYRLNLQRDFSLLMFAALVIGGCALKLLSAGLGARAAGFRGLDAINLAVATNARGGPGIVLASVAFDAGIVNARFYTALVLLAIVTSQAAGAWLEYVMRKGRPLLAAQEVPAAARPDPEQQVAA